MIDLGRPSLHSEGVTIFPDHAVPARFHYLPDAPRLRVRPDGSPDVSLVKYRLDEALETALGAGLLSITVDLGVDDEVLTRLKSRLAQRFGLTEPPQLSPVTADSGTCELVLIERSSADASPTPAEGAAGMGLVERILGASTPSLYGDNTATFSAVLSAEGASLVEGALRGGGLAAGVVYKLRLVGVRPALRAQFTARWDDVWHFYENRFRGGQLLLAADIGTTVQELVQRQAIQLSVDELVPADERPAVYDRVLARVQDYVLETLFKPTLGSASPPEPDAEGGAMATIGRLVKGITGVFGFTYSLRDIDRSELKTLTYRLAASQAERFTVAPQGSLGLILRDAEGRPLDADRFVTLVEGAASQEMRFDVGAAVDLATEGIAYIEVILRYGARVEHVVLEPAAPRKTVSFWYREEDGPELRYQFTAQLAGEETFVPAAQASGAAGLTSEERKSRARVLRVNPRDLYRRVDVRALADGVPFQRFPLVLVDVRADAVDRDWSATHTLTLNAHTVEARWSLRAAPDVEVRIQTRVRYVDAAGVETVTDWASVEGEFVVVGDPFPDVLDVQILGSARFGTEVARLVVELRSKAEPSRVDSRVLTAAQPSATWSRALRDASQRGYEYRVTVHTTRGEVRTGPWLDGADASLVVGEGFAQLRQVQVMLLGKSFASLKLLGVKVRFSFSDAEAGLFAEDEVLVQDAKDPLRFTYPVADVERRAFTYQLTLIGEDGESRVLDPVTTSDKLVVVSLK